MKVIRFMLMAMVAVMMAACSGYSKSTCEELAEKIKSHKELTQSDYSAMIDQYEAIAGQLNDIRNKVKGDAAKEAEILQDEENRDLLGYALMFGLTLSMSDLDDANKEKFEKAQEKYKD